MKFFFLVSLFLFFVFCFLPPKPFLSLSLSRYFFADTQQIHFVGNNKYYTDSVSSALLAIDYLCDELALVARSVFYGSSDFCIFSSCCFVYIFTLPHLTWIMQNKKKKKQKKLFPYVLFYIVFESRSNQWLKLCCGIINAFLYEKFVHKTLLYYHRKKKWKRIKEFVN